MARKKQQPHPIEKDLIHIRDCGETIRVWRSHWHGDQFEVFDKEEWEQVKAILIRLSFVMFYHEGDD